MLHEKLSLNTEEPIIIPPYLILALRLYWFQFTSPNTSPTNLLFTSEDVTDIQYVCALMRMTSFFYKYK